MTHTMKRIWLAGFVRRWHTNPDLAHTCDRLDGHCARVARLVMKLWPDDRVDHAFPPRLLSITQGEVK